MRWITGIVAGLVALFSASRSRRRGGLTAARSGPAATHYGEGGPAARSRVALPTRLTTGLPPPAAMPAETSTTTVSAQKLSPWRLVSGAMFIVLGIVACVYFAYELRNALTLALVALLLAVGLHAPVSYLARFGIPRPVGLLLIYVAAVVALVLALWALFPPVVRDLRAFVEQAPTYLADLQRAADQLGGTVSLPQVEDLERMILSEVSNDWQGYASRIVSVLSFTVGLFGGLLNAFLVLVMSIFMVVEGPRFRDHLLSLLPPRHQRRWAGITNRIALKIQGWMLGTLFLGIVVGAVTTVSLVILGMPYPFLLGFFAGIGECIPMIGPIIAAVPAVAISAFYGWGTFALVLGLYIAIQQLENYVLVPRIMGSQVDLPGLFVIVAFLVGSELAGIAGGILAMPVAAIVQVLWLDWAVPAIRAARERDGETAMQVSSTATLRPSPVP